MFLRESELSHRAAEESLPLRDAFAVLFFVSVGMLFDPQVVMQRPMELFVVIAIIIFGKSIAAFSLVLAMRYPLNTALTISASLAQIGEFSFILAELPITVDQEKLTGQVVIVGYGRVGRRIAEALAAHGVHYVIAEQNRELVERLRKNSVPAVAGDASVPAVLIQAHIARAKLLVIATPDTFHVRKMIEIARALNPTIETVIRTHSEEEAVLLRRENAGEVFMGEHELASGMTRHILERLAKGEKTSLR